MVSLLKSSAPYSPPRARAPIAPAMVGSAHLPYPMSPLIPYPTLVSGGVIQIRTGENVSHGVCFEKLS
jgi:hypothetical protein